MKAGHIDFPTLRKPIFNFMTQYKESNMSRGFIKIKGVPISTQSALGKMSDFLIATL